MGDLRVAWRRCLRQPGCGASGSGRTLGDAHAEIDEFARQFATRWPEAPMR